MLTANQPGLTIGSRRTPGRRRSPTAEQGLLLVGHGSECRASVAQMHVLADLVADALPDVVVDLGFLEMSNPPAGPVLDGLVDGGCRRVVVLPLMLLAAGHGKSDVPAVVLEGRQRHPGTDLRLGSPLGVVHELVAVAGQNVAAAGGSGLPLLVVARGTSDPDANADACKATRLLAEWLGPPATHTAFSGVTWPRVPDGLELFARLGADRIALFFWFLCQGRLIERARDDVRDFAARTGIEVVDAGYFGPDPALVRVVVRRFWEAVDGVPTLNCDTCAYRLPFPGLEDRLHQPLGVGHSPRAAEHRHAGHEHGAFG